MQDIDFDLAGARKAGAKPAQLSSYFKSNFNLDFDFDGAYKAGATDNQILSYLNQSYSDLKKKGNSGVESGVKSSPTPSKYTLKEEAPKKQYYSSKLDKGLIFDKEGQLYAPSSEALTKAIAPPAEDLNLKKSTQKDLVEQSRIPEEKPKKQISIEPSFKNALFGGAPEVKILEEGEDPSVLADISSAIIKGQIQGKVANILSAGKRPTENELGEIAQLQTDSQLFPQSKSEKVYQEKGLKGLFVDSPALGVQFVAETMASSLSALFEASQRTVPAAVAMGAAAGAPFAGIGAIPGATYGFLSGQLTAGYNLSTSQDILNSLSDNGVDISNKESLIKAFSDENKMAKIRNTAAKYGIPILVFDAVTAGLAGKFAAGAIGKSLSRKLLAGLGETGIQIGGGMGGEFTGQLASGKKVNWDDVVMEGLAEVPGGAAEVVTGLQIERSKTASSNKTLATQIATQGIQNGTQDAIVNLNRDLANNVITPEQHQEGVVFVEKAAQVVDKIPETVTGENKAKSIELLVERNDIKENNEILLQQKQASDEAYHAGINEEIKANDEKIKKINDEVFKIAKEPVVEEVEQPIVEEPVEVVEEQAVVEKPKLADKLSTFKEKYTLISEGAAKAIETKKINQQAGKIVPMNTEAAVLAWLSGNNELSWKAINDAAGRKEQARLNVGKDYSTEEVKLRDYAAKKRNGGVGLRDAAHQIWQDLTKRTGDKNITTRDIEGALLNAIRENPTRIDAAKNLISIAGAEEAPISIEEGVEDFYSRKGEQPTEPVVEQGMPEGGFVPFQEGEEEIPFSVQELPTDEVNDMKEIVKDLVEEGLNLNAIRNRIAKELGYDSKRLKETVNKAYQEYTKEYTPEKVTTGVIARIGQFISDLFGGKAEDKVLILKDAQSTFAKAEQMAETGGRVEFQATLPNGEKVTAKPIDASIVNGFYSPLELQINQMKADKMPAKQWLDKLKGEEAKWTGLADWLSQQQGSLSKQEIKDWLQNNQIEINEIVKGRAEDLTEEQVDRLKYLAKLDAENPSGAMEDIEAGSYDEFLTLLNIRDKSSSNDLINLQKQAEQNARLAQQRGNKALADKYWEDSHRYTSRHEVLELSMEGEGGILNPTKFSDLQLEGDKKDYAEILVTLPNNKLQQKVLDLEKIYNQDGSNFNLRELEEARKELEKSKTTSFRSSHFDEANILVHLRMNIRKDAQGKKVLFLEEVQSDWGQKGKKEGFQSGDLQKLETTRNLAREDVKKIDKEIDEYYDKNKIKKIGLTDAEENAYANISAKMRNGVATEEEIAERQLYIEKDTYFDSQYDLAKRDSKFNELLKIKGDKLEVMIAAVQAYDAAYSGHPSAPFVTDTNTWTKLGLKVALKEAVKQGADKIAWTTGEQQVGRYEDAFRKQVDKIESEKFEAESGRPSRVRIIAYKNGAEVFNELLPIDGKTNIRGKDITIEDIVGKDIAQKIRAGEQNQNFEGNQLTIGGSGMKGFYGSTSEGSLGILGNMAKSLFKQEPSKISIISSQARINELQKEMDLHQEHQTYFLSRRDDAYDNGDNEKALEMYALANKSGQLKESVLSDIKKIWKYKDGSDQLQYSINITPELKAQVEVGLPLFMANPEGDILGFKFQDKIYLNGEKLNPNTPIHEAGHIWTEWVKQFDNKVYQRGIELVKNSEYLKEVKSSKFYQEQAKKLATKQEAELYFQHEALAMAIGDKGAQFVTESRRTSFKEWLDALWTKIKDLAGFKDITAEELQNLTFEEFTKMAVKDILGKQFEGRTLQEIYETLPMGKKLRQNKEEILIRDNFDNIVAELIKNNKIEKIC